MRGDGNKIGPAMVLKVMAGDAFNLRVSSWYKLNGSTPNSPSPITTLAQALAGSVAGVSGGKVTEAELSSSGLPGSAATSFLNSQSYNSARPKAFINWIFLDEQFKYYAGGFEQVGTDQEFKVHLYNGVAINKSGYLYIYVSNETPNIDVFFDNLQVTHVRGPMVEETHYYAFGFTMAGVSSKALSFGSPENKRKFNKGSELEKKEFNDGSGLEWYATNFRSLDPQLGRWWQIDPKPDYAQSLYSSMGNNPILYNDPLGDTLRVSFKTGFLGLGRRREVIYNNGSLTNSDGSAYTGKVKGYLGKVTGALQSLRNTGEGNAMVTELQGSTNNFTIRNGSSNKFEASNTTRSFGNIPEVMATVGTGGTTMPGGSGGTIYWNPNISTSGMNTAGNINRPSFIGLGHEMAHARDANNGTLYPSNDYTNPLTGATYHAMHNGLKKAEWRAVFMENIIRMQAGVDLRVNYGLSVDGETVSGTGPSTVQTITLFGIQMTLPINYQVR